MGLLLLSLVRVITESTAKAATPSFRSFTDDLSNSEMGFMGCKKVKIRHQHDVLRQ